MELFFANCFLSFELFAAIMATIKKNKATEAPVRKEKAAEKKADLAQVRKVEAVQKWVATIAKKKKKQLPNG